MVIYPSLREILAKCLGSLPVKVAGNYRQPGPIVGPHQQYDEGIEVDHLLSGIISHKVNQKQ